jgi:hypothetical protein
LIFSAIFSHSSRAHEEILSTDYYQLGAVGQTISSSPEAACSDTNMAMAWGGGGLYNINLTGSNYEEPPLCTSLTASCSTNYACTANYISSLGSESSWLLDEAAIAEKKSSPSAEKSVTLFSLIIIN